jgi:hypothetical protein
MTVINQEKEGLIPIPMQPDSFEHDGITLANSFLGRRLIPLILAYSCLTMAADVVQDHMNKGRGSIYPLVFNTTFNIVVEEHFRFFSQFSY